MKRTKPVPASPYRRYAVPLVPEEARTASPALIHYHVREAARLKQWAASVTEEWLETASFMSLAWVSRLLDNSVHITARRGLEYHRMRAHHFYQGIPTDRPAHTLWYELSGCSKQLEGPQSVA